MITIIDYGMGNLGSVVNMFERIGVLVNISADLTVIKKASKLLLPGVGAFDKAMIRINSCGLREVLDRKATVECVSILGICLGMQLLACSSEEGKLHGLGWIRATSRRFPARLGIKVPHMGWNVVKPTRGSLLTQDLPNESRFYFVHSYYVCVDHPDDCILKATHGLTFDAAIQHDNIYGVQFHPEKSHKFGMQLLRNFANL